ncbi:MAG: hypothetical protein RR256_07960, partial [Bacteroidales bacterium]
MKRTYFIMMWIALLFFPALTANARNIQRVKPDKPANQILNGALKTSSGKTAYGYSVWTKNNYVDSLGFATFNTADVSTMKINRYVALGVNTWGGAVVDGFLYHFKPIPDSIAFAKENWLTGKKEIISAVKNSKTLCMTDLTYDYTTNTMYFIGSILWGDNEAAWLGTVNLTTGKLDTLGETPFIVGLACNSKG